MIDIHAHVLPGIDDGARDDDQALNMLRIAAADGITHVIATPHAHHAARLGIAIRDEVWQLNQLAHAQGIPVTVLPGSEVRIASGLPEQLAAGQLLTLNNSRYLLLELSLHDEWPLPLVEGVLEKLLATDIVPVLAHAERYPFVQRDPGSVQRFGDLRVPVQINARALFYRADDIERVTAERLLRARLAHLLASDAHNDTYRPPLLRAAYDRVAELTDPAYAAWMCFLPQFIIDDEEIALTEDHLDL